jgi:hypothetical protein
MPGLRISSSKMHGVRVRSKLPGEFRSVPNYPKSLGPFHTTRRVRVRSKLPEEFGSIPKCNGLGSVPKRVRSKIPRTWVRSKFPGLGSVPKFPGLGSVPKCPAWVRSRMLTCNEGEEVDAEYGEDLHLGLIVHAGVHRDGSVPNYPGLRSVPEYLRLRVPECC